MIERDIRNEIVDLLCRYVYFLDHGKLEDWVECFSDNCRYKIITRENVEAGLPAGMLDCQGKDMLRDRVSYIRLASVSNIHRDRHILGAPHVTQAADGSYDVVTNFVVFQSEPDRDSRLFCLGYYEDKVVLVDGLLKLREKTVVLDNDSVTPLLSTPL